MLSTVKKINNNNHNFFFFKYKTDHQRVYDWLSITAKKKKKPVVLKLHQWGVLGNSPNINTMWKVQLTTLVLCTGKTQPFCTPISRIAALSLWTRKDTSFTWALDTFYLVRNYVKLFNCIVFHNNDFNYTSPRTSCQRWVKIVLNFIKIREHYTLGNTNCLVYKTCSLIVKGRGFSVVEFQSIQQFWLQWDIAKTKDNWKCRHASLRRRAWRPETETFFVKRLVFVSKRIWPPIMEGPHPPPRWLHYWCSLVERS